MNYSHIAAELSTGLKQGLCDLSNTAIFDDIHHHFEQVARDGGNLFEVMMDIVEYCSVGQVTQALFETGGKFRRNM